MRNLTVLVALIVCCVGVSLFLYFKKKRKPRLMNRRVEDRYTPFQELKGKIDVLTQAVDQLDSEINLLVRKGARVSADFAERRRYQMNVEEREAMKQELARLVVEAHKHYPGRSLQPSA